jgi:(p)ppGpp synthase/HD superfamily hydrolase
MKPSARFHKALSRASELHEAQPRKGTEIPYVSHLLGVCAVVLDNGGSETEAIAALLHDAAEDQGGTRTLQRIGREFGDEVAAIVAACSDALAENPASKPPWMERKQAYLKRLRAEDDSAVLLVSAADKLDNLRSIERDFRELGDALWGRFRGGKEGTLWYYRELSQIFDAKPGRTQRIAAELRSLLERLPSSAVAS